MTKRNPDMDCPMVVSIVVDYSTFQDFKKLVGDQNASKEIRAMIKDRVNLQKNEQALAVDPLNLGLVTKSGKSALSTSENTRQCTLFETFATGDRRDEISKYVNSIRDKPTIDKVWTHSKVMYDIADRRRKEMARGILK